MTESKENKENRTLLSYVTLVSATMPCRVLLYGEAGVGKTTFASEFPDALFIDLEGGIPKDLNVMAIPTLIDELKKYNRIIEELTFSEHNFKTIVIDTLSALNNLIVNHVKNQLGNKFDVYGAGMRDVMRYWSYDIIPALDTLRKKRKVRIVLITHEAKKTFTNALGESHEKHIPLIPDKLNDIFSPWVDACLRFTSTYKKDVVPGNFGAKKTVAVNLNTTTIYANNSVNMCAKNRYGLPDKFIYQKGKAGQYIAMMEPNAPKKPQQTNNNNTEQE